MQDPDPVLSTRRLAHQRLLLTLAVLMMATPQLLARQAPGRVTVHATRIETPPKVDGVLDENVYRTLTPVTGLIQQDPDEGAVATEPTLVWTLFDQTTLYISARCRDSQPARIVANDMRRDGRNVSQNDNLSVVLDTFHDRRNGFEFLVNSIGGMWDSQITDERDANRDWNAVWVSRSRRDGEGWTVEMAIPFRSLRYRGSGPQVWGINVRRNVRWKNELSQEHAAESENARYANRETALIQSVFRSAVRRHSIGMWRGVGSPRR